MAPVIELEYACTRIEIGFDPKQSGTANLTLCLCIFIYTWAKGFLYKNVGGIK